MADKEARIYDIKDDIRESDIANDDDEIRPRSRDEWIDGKQMMQIIAQEKAEEQRREEVEAHEQQLRRRDPFQNTSGRRPHQSLHTNNLASRISYTDANTLEIDIPSPGIDSNAFVSGAFSALWFSAVIPATVGMLSAGFLPALFMSPFWLAGGVVAKNAVYDPFISSTLSIGQYLWSVEKKYAGSVNTKKEEGATESLKGAEVELAMVVNNVGLHQLRLYFDDSNGSVTFGKGLAVEELEYLSRVINDHCSMLRDNQQEF